MSGYGVTLDAASGVLHAVRDGWGDYGYRVQELAGSLDGSALALISHADGSEFWVCADRYGVVIGQGFDTPEAAQTAFARSLRGGSAMSGTVATPAADEWDLYGCKHCGAELVTNYDGRGTGFSHLYADEPMRNGTKECAR